MVAAVLTAGPGTTIKKCQPISEPSPFLGGLFSWNGLNSLPHHPSIARQRGAGCLRPGEGRGLRDGATAIVQKHRLVGEKAHQARCKARDVIGRGEDARRADDLRQAGGVAADDGDAAGQRFERRQAEALVARGEDEDARPTIERGLLRLRHKPHEVHSVLW